MGRRACGDTRDGLDEAPLEFGHVPIEDGRSGDEQEITVRVHIGLMAAENLAQSALGAISLNRVADGCG
jgi:hypothetical protein